MNHIVTLNIIIVSCCEVGIDSHPDAQDEFDIRIVLKVVSEVKATYCVLKEGFPSFHSFKVGITSCRCPTKVISLAPPRGAGSGSSA